MSVRMIRVYEKLDINEIKKHLMIYGALSASCANCNNLGLKLEITRCPSCSADFKYLSFQNVKDHASKLQRLSETRPDLKFIDYDDFKRLTGELRAKEFLK